jgi:succinate dehydrogenase / fumarate reductase membrane anchor subunit
MLLELRQNAKWEKFVTLFTLAAMLAVIGYGTRTIIIVNGLNLG